MALSNDILSSTLRILRDKEVDNLHRTTPLLSEIISMGMEESVDGGSKVNCPVIMAEHSTMTQLSTGYESTSLSVSDPLRQSEYNWCDFTAPIVITRKEELTNKGDKAIIKIAEARLKSVMGMLRREWEKQVVAGTSTILTELQTLNGITGGIGPTATPATNDTGWFETEAFGSQDNTVGELPKGTYTTSWQNQAVDANTVGFNRAMATAMVQASTYAPEGEIKVILASPEAYEEYKNDLFSQERFISGQETSLDGGRLSLAFNGARMFIEPNLGFAHDHGGSGTRHGSVDMYMLNPQLMRVYFDKDAKFALSDFQKVSGYVARSADVLVRTQIGTANLSGHGVIYTS